MNWDVVCPDFAYDEFILNAVVDMNFKCGNIMKA